MVMRAKRKNDTPVAIRVIQERPARVFAVGDIHGCFDEAKALLEHLKRERAAGPSDLFVFMGDYIDRGSQSKQVLDLLLEVQREWPHTVFLKGNHEDMLLDYLGFGGDSCDVYIENGGAEFLKSYGLHPFTPRADILAAIPEAHIRFLQGLELGVELAEFVFVHVGIRPNVSLAKQSIHDVMWIRGDFVHAEHSLGKTIVFGHTPFEDVFLHLPHKIGLDTGLIFGNKLSVVELVQGDVFQVERGESAVRSYNLRTRLGG